MIPKTLSPHEHKLFTEILTRVRLGIRAVELLHVSLEGGLCHALRLNRRSRIPARL